MQITLAFLAALVAIVASETCHKLNTTSYSCAVTQCTVGEPECVDIMGIHVCTCMHVNEHNTLATCTLKADCDKIATFTSSCTVESARHCVDSNCRCQVNGHGNHGHGHGNGLGNK
ncbi:uncharacterized protein LOC117332374 [Pecten maximus]|uniref:uncharacterized protein LOC117332374 n=1 Tax=Pecten maximus TaxID=6579 RepID=UPI0014588813|nr:uncharacterized protein LOC117332374 [Pecten maximus]